MDSETGLPPTFPLFGFTGSFADYIDVLYWLYTTMIHSPGVTVRGRRVVSSGVVAADGRDELFWHLVTTGTGVPGGEPRRFSLGRAESLPRTRALLDRFAQGDPNLWWWRDAFGCLNVVPPDWSHRVILRKRGERLILKTAYPVRGAAEVKRQARASWAMTCMRDVELWELSARARIAYAQSSWAPYGPVMAPEYDPAAGARAGVDMAWMA